MGGGVVGGVGAARLGSGWVRLDGVGGGVVAVASCGAGVGQLVRADVEGSVEVEPGDYENRSFWFKLGVHFARLTAPIQ